MQDNILYVTHMIRSKALHTKHVYISGCKIQAFTDFVNMKYGRDNEKEIWFILVQDIFSKYVYATVIPKVEPEAVTKGFLRLFRAGMPHFSLLRCDRDVVLRYLKDKVFTPRNMLLQVHRSKNYLSILDTTAKIFEKKLSQFFLRYPNANQEKAIKKVTYGYNHTIHGTHQFTPSEINSPIYDPIVRARLPEEPFEPFETFLTKNLELKEKLAKPPKKDDLSYKSFRVGTKVLIDFPKVIKRGYEVKRGNIYEIASIITSFGEPWLFRLRHTFRGKVKIIPGYYSGLELFKLPSSKHFLETKIIAKIKRRNQRYKLIRYKNLPR